MIKIDRDYRSGTGDMYKVSTSEPGFGRGWSIRRLTLDAALETVKHYYGVGHDAMLCGHCVKRKKVA